MTSLVLVTNLTSPWSRHLEQCRCDDIGESWQVHHWNSKLHICKKHFFFENQAYHWNFQNRSYCRWEWEWNHQLEPGGRNTECIQKPWTQVQPLIQAGPSPSFAGRYFQKTRGTVETSWHFCKNYIGIKINWKL